MTSANSADILVIGGGPAGMTAAIAAARCGARVLLAERMGRVGSKLLATGGGRCNLSNTSLNAARYHGGRVSGAFSLLETYGHAFAAEYFESLGVLTATEDGGRVYPRTFQASTVLDALRAELVFLGVAELTNCRAVSVESRDGAFFTSFESAPSVVSKKVIIASGGSASKALGSDGSGYALLAKFGHRLIAPAPTLTQIRLGKGGVGGLKGIRANARVKLVRHMDGRMAETVEASTAKTAEASTAETAEASTAKTAEASTAKTADCDAAESAGSRAAGSDDAHTAETAGGGGAAETADSYAARGAGGRAAGNADCGMKKRAAGNAVKPAAGNAGQCLAERARENERVIYEEAGEILFTDYGVSGIPILNVSGYIAPYLSERGLYGGLARREAGLGDGLARRAGHSGGGLARRAGASHVTNAGKGSAASERVRCDIRAVAAERGELPPKGEKNAQLPMTFAEANSTWQPWAGTEGGALPFTLVIDMFPEFDALELQKFLFRRIAAHSSYGMAQILSGLLNKRLIRPILAGAGVHSASAGNPMPALAHRIARQRARPAVPAPAWEAAPAPAPAPGREAAPTSARENAPAPRREAVSAAARDIMSVPASELPEPLVEQIADAMKNWRIPINGVMGFDSAQATYGGLSTDDFHIGTLESRIAPGLYAAGEILDMAGDCGGYNLQWAWASGYAAGMGAAASLRACRAAPRPAASVRPTA
jgi:predicted flavoprotein YhiN